MDILNTLWLVKSIDTDGCYKSHNSQKTHMDVTNHIILKNNIYKKQIDSILPCFFTLIDAEKTSIICDENNSLVF